MAGDTEMTTKKAGNHNGARRNDKGPLIHTRTKPVIRERWDEALKEMGNLVGNATGDVLRASNLVEMWAVWFSTRPKDERIKWARAYRAAFSRQLDRIETGQPLEVEAGTVAATPDVTRPGAVVSLGRPGPDDQKGPEPKLPPRPKGK